ncbi:MULTISPECIES: hypothetical protein [unclassified Agrococcus]|uniref:hypothetical protein n=1 Tax=unclassified Agrococcus TaxID=2615065 RepID=UPI00361DE2D1
MRDDDVRGAVVWAAWAARREEPSVGRTWIPLDGSSTTAPEAPVRTSADVAHAIVEASVVVDDAAIDAALGAAVGSAMSWQEPDAEDDLASSPDVVAAMLPIAERIAASGHWLHAGRAPGSWLVRWDETPPRPPIDLRAARDAAHAEDEAMRAHALDAPGPPLTGSWWSTPQTPETVGRLPIALDLVEDELGWRGATAVAVREPERLLRIDSASAWVALARAHPLETTFARRHDWGRATGEQHRWIVPDWAAVAEHHDAVHLDVRCWLEGAGRALPLDDERATVIAGWSPDATVRLHEPIPLDAHRPRRFERDEGDAWVEVDAARQGLSRRRSPPG